MSISRDLAIFILIMTDMHVDKTKIALYSPCCARACRVNELCDLGSTKTMYMKLKSSYQTLLNLNWSTYH